MSGPRVTAWGMFDPHRLEFAPRRGGLGFVAFTRGGAALDLECGCGRMLIRWRRAHWTKLAMRAQTVGYAPSCDDCGAEVRLRWSAADETIGAVELTPAELEREHRALHRRRILEELAHLGPERAAARADACHAAAGERYAAILDQRAEESRADRLRRQVFTTTPRPLWLTASTHPAPRLAA